jgi:mannosyltransferase
MAETGPSSSGGVAVAPPVTTGPTPPGGAAVRPQDGAVEDPEGPPFRRSMRLLLAGGVVAVILAGLALRFWTKSDLWLDEALTVNVARLPLRELPSFLRRDGAPPLYYVLLHVWMGWFGQSDIAVRSLSGVIGLVTLPFAWFAGRRLGGRTVAWAALVLVATSPFAVRYDTETRMYALVALLTVLGFLALDRSLRRPRPGNLVAVALVTGLLLYTHYWSVYLIGTVVLWLAFQAWRGRPGWQSGARASLAAVLVGCLTFVPWLPTFVFQSRHTGTPWATPANFAAMVNAIASFAGGSSSQGRALALLFFALAGLGLFGLAVNRRHVDLDLRTRPLGRPLAVAVTGTLAAAIVGGFVTRSAFDARYASVVFIPIILLVAVGLTVFLDRRVRAGLLALAAVLGLASAVPNVVTNRTQAGQVAAHIAAAGQPGDVVAYCPDQLAPAVNRLLPPGRYRQITFPRGSGPEFVNWVDYADAVRAGSVTGFAARVESMAANAGGVPHRIFVVWASGYQAYGFRCEGIVQTLQGNAGYHAEQVVTGNPISFYQPMWMVQLTPTAG